MRRKSIKTATMKNNFFPDNIYKIFIDKLPICTVDVLFFDKNGNKALLFKRKNKPIKNIYFSCGGRLLKNEKFEDCAIRQVKKELGLKLDKKKLIFGGVINEIYKDSIYKKVNAHCVNIYFGYLLEEIDAKKIIFDDQHFEYKWFDINNKGLYRYIKEKISVLKKVL